MAISRLLARPLLSSIFVYGGLNALKNPEPLREKARRVSDRIAPLAQSGGLTLPQDPTTLVRINGATQVAAATALAMGKMPRLSASVLAATLVPTTMAGHAFWEETDPAARASDKTEVAKNLSLLGGLMLAAVDTEGKPGMAWRARRATRDVRRQARHLTREAKLEAKLAAKSLT